MAKHKSNQLQLPPLVAKYTDGRTLVEKDLMIQSLISSKLLLSKELNSLLSSLLGYTKNISHIISEANKQVEDQQSKEQKKMSKKKFLLLEAKNKKILRDLKQISKKIQHELQSVETTLNLQLNIIEATNVYTCIKCKALICKGRFQHTRCPCGKLITKRSEYDTIVIHILNEQTIKFIELNMWLEYGIRHILNKRDFVTFCGPNILGHSGIWHEIDVVGEYHKENLRIFGECKNTEIGVNDIFIFSGKMQDIGCTRGYIFTTALTTSKPVILLARSKNITVIDRVLEKQKDEIVDEIVEGKPRDRITSTILTE